MKNFRINYRENINGEYVKKVVVMHDMKSWRDAVYAIWNRGVDILVDNIEEVQ